MFRSDRTINGGGLIIYIKDYIPAKEIKFSFYPNDIEVIIIEVNLWRRKLIICGSYNPHENTISYHLNNLGKFIDSYMRKCDNFLLLGDYNCEEKETAMENFFCCYNFKKLVKNTHASEISTIHVYDLISMYI